MQSLRKVKQQNELSNRYWDKLNLVSTVNVAAKVNTLLSSKDKFESGCGWLAISLQLHSQMLPPTREDKSYNMTHGGAMRSQLERFSPWPSLSLRTFRTRVACYCINSLSIPLFKDQMEEKGYALLLEYVD